MQVADDMGCGPSEAERMFLALARVAQHYFRMIRMRMGMEKSHFFEGLMIGLFLFFLSAYSFRSNDNAANYISICGANALLFPFSRRAVENIVFSVTGKRFWGSDPLKTAASNGGHTLLWLFYFVFAVPLGGFYLMWFYRKK